VAVQAVCFAALVDQPVASWEVLLL